MLKLLRRLLVALGLMAPEQAKLANARKKVAKAKARVAHKRKATRRSTKKS